MPCWPSWLRVILDIVKDTSARHRRSPCPCRCCRRRHHLRTPGQVDFRFPPPSSVNYISNRMQYETRTPCSHIRRSGFAVSLLSHFRPLLLRQIPGVPSRCVNTTIVFSSPRELMFNISYCFRWLDVPYLRYTSFIRSPSLCSAFFPSHLRLSWISSYFPVYCGVRISITQSMIAPV